MFPSFTGSARPRRQVNLSGRNQSPFASAPKPRQTTSSHTSQNTLAYAQQERVLRQQERERPPAAIRIQSRWRGYRCRELIKNQWRREWDQLEAANLKKGKNPETILEISRTCAEVISYVSEEVCLKQLRLLVHFASPQSYDDVLRLRLFASRYLRSLQSLPSTFPEDVWTYPLLRLAKIAIAVLRRRQTDSLSPRIENELLDLLAQLCIKIPKQLSLYSCLYYASLACLSSKFQASSQSFDQRRWEKATVALLKPLTVRTVAAYKGFARELLATPDLATFHGSLGRVSQEINYKILTSAVNELLLPSDDCLLTSKNHEELLWLLAYFIYFHRAAHGSANTLHKAPEAQYVNAVSKLVFHLADDIAMRMEVGGNLLSTDEDGPVRSPSSLELLPSFVCTEIQTLINQDSISSLLAHLELVPSSVNEIPGSSNQASLLASLALTLLRCFPRKADDIRMWLYLGSTQQLSSEADKLGSRLPAVKYFYLAARTTNVYGLISKDPREAVNLLRSQPTRARSEISVTNLTTESIDQQWRIILLFMELYAFVLKVMDDEEFLSGSTTSTEPQSWTRQSALHLDQVRDLTVFLKNLAFSTYWNASEINGFEVTETKNSIAEYFGGNTGLQSLVPQEQQSRKNDERAIAGLAGVSLNYMKGMVTGLLRMIYERE